MMFKYCRLILMLCAIFSGSIGLSGCLRNVLPFAQITSYDISGIEDDEDTRSYLEKILKERVADNIEYEEQTPDFDRAEAAREEQVSGELLKALKAKGYYDAEVNYLDDKNQSLKGVYQIQPGDVYTISSLVVNPKIVEEHFDTTLIKAGDVLEAQKIIEAQNALYEAVQKDQCYFSLDVDHSVVLNKNTKTAELTYDVQMGKSTTFGDVIFEGRETVKESYLRKIVTWKQGDCFRKEKIRSLQTKLLETGLFVRVDSKLPEAPDDDGRVPVTLELKERVHRSIKAGASYYTDKGAGVTLGWEHRNILGAGEKLETELNITEISYSLDADFTKPYFLRKDQSLAINAALRQEDTDAFEQTTFESGISIKRKINKRLSANVGVQFAFSEITDENDTDTYGLLSFPVGLSFDNRDNQLDPHRGWYLTASTEPFYDMLGESDPFNKVELGARTYIDVADKPDMVVAARANVSSLLGSDTANIPATERFYAGGGGSVRGFGYQQVGPFQNGDPTGGRSAVTASTELRVKFTDTLGGVAFVDAGSVSENIAPDLDNLSFGAGVGVRYYTGFGPLRFDVAVPLNQKENLDQNYQFYISIGQAF